MKDTIKFTENVRDSLMSLDKEALVELVQDLLLAVEENAHIHNRILGLIQEDSDE